MKRFFVCFILIGLSLTIARAGNARDFAYSADRAIPGCANLGTGSEACHWSYYYSNKCLRNKCSKLLIYFSGGQMTCPNPEKEPGSSFARYADAGYVSVCARIFENESTSGQFPFIKEAPRVNLLMKSITSDPAIMQAWTGEGLLISGVSHGSTAAVIAMARKEFDSSQTHWRGTKTTGACFYDGIYEAHEGLAREFEDSCQTYKRHYSRYCSWTGGVDSPSTWPNPDSCQNPDMSIDTVTGINPANFAISNWKLVQCGSGLDFCSKDMVPAEPQWKLCKDINRDSNKSCEFDGYPLVSHSNCGGTFQTMDACRNWFDVISVSDGAENLSFGEICPANSTCKYSGTHIENMKSSMACAGGQVLSVHKTSYWGSSQKPFGSWSNCKSYVYNKCENYSSCNLTFNNLWCAGDPDVSHEKNATVIVSCGPGTGIGTGNDNSNPFGVMQSSDSINQDSPYLTSDSTNNFLALWPNGEVVLFDQDFLGSLQITHQMWQNGVNISSSRLPYLKLGSDGVLSELGKAGAVIWRSDNWATTKGGAGLVMQNDGNLVIYDLLGNALWASGTTWK